MCLSRPQVPQLQAPKMPEPPPPPPAPVTSSMPTTVRPRSRARTGSAGSTGAASLTIPLSTGGAMPTGPVNLNIGK